MGKELLFPQDNKTEQAVIHNAKVDILMALYYCKEDFIDGISERCLQEKLKVTQFNGYAVTPQVFCTALEKAVAYGWVRKICTVIYEGHASTTRVRIELTKKGREVARREYEIICFNN